MKKNRVSDKIISLVFIVLLIIPMLVFLVSAKKSVSLSEKRNLAEFPKISWSYKCISTFSEKFDQYFSDHFGLRSEIVQFHNYICYRVFGISPVETVIAGEKGWFYLNLDGSLYDYMGYFTYTRTELQKIERVLLNRTKWLHSMGVQYLFLPIPNKEFVHVEYFPSKYRKLRGASKYDQIVNFIKKGGQFKNYIDVQNLFLEHKGARQLYCKTDSHWSESGVFTLYKELMKVLRGFFPEMQPLPEVDRLVWRDRESGDLAHLMNLNGKITERISGSFITMECGLDQMSETAEMREIEEYASVPARYMPLKMHCSGKKRKAVFIHDSFGRSLVPYLQQHFGELVSVRFMNFEGAKPLIEKIQPDIVIDLRIARNIEKALLDDPELQAYVDALTIPSP